VIDEDLDQRVLKAMQTPDEAALAAIPESYSAGQHLRDPKLDSAVGRHERVEQKDDTRRLRAVLPHRGRHG